MQEYVVDIQILVGKEAQTPKGYKKIDIDLNREAGGEYIYLFYKTATEGEAITDIVIITGKDANPPSGYTKIPIDLNKGAKGDYIYLCYQKGSSDDIRVIRDLIILVGYNAKAPEGYTKIDIDLNSKAGGDYLYLAYKNEISIHKWMKQVSGNKLISDISMPGTHDSLTFDLKGISSLVATAAQAQSKSILQQLTMGVRYFDIRIDEELDGRHGITVCSYGLRNTLSWMSKFLMDYQSEIIVMRLKTEGDVDNKKRYRERLDEIFREYDAFLWKNGGSEEIPTLDEVRGKIIILDELGSVYSLYSKGYGLRYGGANQNIQDKYNKPDEDKKYREVIEYIQTKKPGILTLNHISATGTAAGILPGTWSPKDYAEYLNPRVDNYLVRNKCVTGILIFDFIDEEESMNVIKENFR